ncbi:MAG: alpha/beta hydrolase [Acetobacteraceae bacterium]|nr:alpha/beta hydrolase [Acetobacteraceae bacterium]
MTSAVSWTDSSATVAGVRLNYSRAGKGAPVVVLHHDIGSVDRLPFYDALTATNDTVVIHLPGYGKSERPDWMRHPRDIAAMVQWLLDDLNIKNTSVVGLGFGGWIAAEMASQGPSNFSKLVLVGAMGVKPPQGDIMDQALVNYIEYARAGFHTDAAFKSVYGDVSIDQLEIFDLCREMSFRIAWKPYMYSQTLPHLLGGVRASALVVVGEHDKIVPHSAAGVYVQALRSARREVVAGSGHCVDMEKPAELAGLVTKFING